MIRYSEIEEIVNNLYQPDKFSRDVIRQAFIDYIYTFRKEFEIEIEESNERIEDLEDDIDCKEDEIEAMKVGYYRIFCGHELDIDSYKEPDEREFKAVQYAIEQNSYKKFDSTRWSVYTEKGFWFFPKLSFLFAESLLDGKLKTFR